MKSTSLALCTILLAAPVAVYAGEQIIPAGSLISCTVSEPKLSSKTTNIGDPVLCQLGMTERYGRSVLPYNSYLVGRFEDYRDPGHFVGKGWMELKFDRMVIEPDTVIPVDARVVDVPGYSVDRYGRILGKGHAVRDTVTWLIPILWPIDLLELPRRGPRPTLKEETRLTLKVMDDLGVPMNDQQPMPQQDSNGLYRRPSAYQAPPPQPAPEPQQAPVAMNYNPAPPPPPVMAYVPMPSPPPVYYVYPRPVVPIYVPRRPVIIARYGYPY
ncbi:MAG TPA: hypothetical protein VFB43_03200 [Terracidiphilus sp.]|nr:hypothetical protein [Terracidiphilus sp.]